jgi:hypothetical protein
MRKRQPQFDLKPIWRSLDDDQRTQFAALVGVTPAYIEVCAVYARKMPRPATINGLVRACAAFGHNVAREQLVMFFLDGVDQQRAAKRRRAVASRGVSAHVG